MKEVALIGGGALARQFIHHLRIAQTMVHGVYDDTMALGTEVAPGVQVLGNLAAFFSAPPVGTEVMVAIGYRHMRFRRELALRLRAAGVPLHTFIHTSAVVDPTATIGAGSVIYPGSIIDAEVRIGDNVLVNIGCTIAHDSLVGSHSFLAPGVVLSGDCRVGECNFLGTGTLLRDGMYTAEGVVTGIGSVVVTELSGPGTFVGNPAKQLLP